MVSSREICKKKRNQDSWGLGLWSSKVFLKRKTNQDKYTGDWRQWSNNTHKEPKSNSLHELQLQNICYRGNVYQPFAGTRYWPKSPVWGVMTFSVFADLVSKLTIKVFLNAFAKGLTKCCQQSFVIELWIKTWINEYSKNTFEFFWSTI